jgi:hypothetical protein
MVLGGFVLLVADCRVRQDGQGTEVAMPLTKKGSKIKSAMKKEYGAKKGEKVFYAAQNKGTIKGTHKGGKGKK